MPRWPTFKAPHVCTYYGWKNIGWYSTGSKSSFKYTSKSSLCFWIFGLDCVWLEMIALKGCPPPFSLWTCGCGGSLNPYVLFPFWMKEGGWYLKGHNPRRRPSCSFVTLNNNMYVKVRMLVSILFYLIGHMCLSVVDLRVLIKRHMSKEFWYVFKRCYLIWFDSLYMIVGGPKWRFDRNIQPSIW